MGSSYLCHSICPLDEISGVPLTWYRGEGGEDFGGSDDTGCGRERKVHRTFLSWGPSLTPSGTSSGMTLVRG